MSALAVFTREGHDLRTLLVDGEPWFVAADVARMLGHTSTATMTRRLDDDDKGVQRLHTLGGEQEFVTINEPGLYAAILGSHIPEAKAFKRWVTHEVLPAIRRTGTYTLPAADPSTLTLADYAQHLVTLGQRAIESEAAREAAEARAIEATERVEQLEPAAAAWQHLASSDGDHSVGDAAKILSRAPGVTIGQKRLFGLLKEWRWLYRDSGDNWHPYQAHVDNGRLAQRAMSHHHPRTGELVIDAPQVRITGKGLSDIHARLARPLAVVSA